MSDHSSPMDIKNPSHRRLALIGGTTAACALAWLATIGAAPTSAAADMPLEIFLTILAVAVCTTIVAVILSVSYAGQKAVADNQRCIVMALGSLAAEQEQESQKLDLVAEKLGRIDPWTIYTAVYEDLFLKERNN